MCPSPCVCPLPETRVSPCELHAPAARHGPCAAARARCARPACVVRCLEVKQHNVTPPPCRPKLPVYEHQLNLKLVTSTSVKSLKKTSENTPAGSASGPVFPGACQVYPSHRLHTSTVQVGSPGIPDDNNEARTLCERRQRSRAAGSQQSSRARPALPTQSSTEGFHLTLPYLTSKEKKERKKNRTTSELHSHVMSNENKFPSKNTRVPTKLQFMY